MTFLKILFSLLTLCTLTGFAQAEKIEVDFTCEELGTYDWIEIGGKEEPGSSVITHLYIIRHVDGEGANLVASYDADKIFCGQRICFHTNDFDLTLYKKNNRNFAYLDYPLYNLKSEDPDCFAGPAYMYYKTEHPPLSPIKD